MQAMSPAIGWNDVVLRLALTVLAGVLIGLDRDEHGKPAGIRTTTLVALAASVAMLQANSLLPTTGKAPSSYIVLDLMRLPLGILSGVGFLGAGVIIRHSNRISGVTTAATLWIVTVIGLCFGGGQLVLGVLATVIGIAILWLFKLVEQFMVQDHQGMLTVVNRRGDITEELAAFLRKENIRIAGHAIKYSDHSESTESRYELRWRARRGDPRPPDFLAMVAAWPSVISLEWAPHGVGEI
jgi:putative Mg2+ transporter-C (MgtC) family protein